jgi:hypothetical protein
MKDPVSEWLVNHPTAVSEFLVTYPTTTKWLDDIIDALLHEPNGTAHVTTLAHKLRQHSEERDILTIEATITRRINDFCSNAADFNKSRDHDLFERVERATYRLRSFPEKPDIYELTTIRFVDPAMLSMWKIFRNFFSKGSPRNGRPLRTGENSKALSNGCLIRLNRNRTRASRVRDNPRDQG